MDKLLWFLISIVLLFILIVVVIKITSLLIRILLWCVIGFLCIYLINYFFLPKIGKTPLPIKEFFYKSKQGFNKQIEKEISDKLKSVVEKHTKSKEVKNLKK
jgi:energy-coupling factor transporter transmembrane protein EcfT